MVPSTSSPKLFFDMLAGLVIRKGGGSSLWTVNEVLLALGLRIWSEDAARWDPYRALDTICPRTAEARASIRRGDRLLQFLVDTARVMTLRMVLGRATHGRLPVELVDVIFEELLSSSNLPHPREIAAIWVPWPERRACGQCLGGWDFSSTCAKSMRARWLPETRKFELYHPLMSAQSHTKACRLGTCRSHHAYDHSYADG